MSKHLNLSSTYLLGPGKKLYYTLDDLMCRSIRGYCTVKLSYNAITTVLLTYADKTAILFAEKSNDHFKIVFFKDIK